MLGSTIAESEIEALVNKLSRRKAAALAELRNKYSEAVEEAISLSKARRGYETVEALDGAAAYAYPNAYPSCDDRIEWGVLSADDGVGIWCGFRRPDGADEEVMIQTPDLTSLPPKEALAYLVDEHLQSMRIEQRERWEYQYVELLLDFLRDTGKADGVPWTKERLQGAIEYASELIAHPFGSLWSACQRNDNHGDPPLDEPERYRLIWRHRDLRRALRDGFTSTEACPMDRDSVAGVADKYLQQDLRSPKFEALLVDALVAREVYAFGEELKQNPSRYMKRLSFNMLAVAMDETEAYDEAKGNFDKLAWAWMKRRLKWAIIRAALLYGVPIAVVWIAAVNNRGGVAFAAGAFVAVLVAYRLLSWVWRNLRRLFKEPAKEPLEEAFELHGKMVRAYNELKDGTSSSPQRVREVLTKIADEGAAWDPRVFSVLDAAIARSRGNWG